MSKLLEGIRVIEVAIYAFVPAGGAVLAEWGAEVIKLEDPEYGDPLRGLSSYGVEPGQGGVDMLWEVFNRGKKSVGINIRHADGLALLMTLVDQADVFITNFIPATCKRLGIDEASIRARNPRIIYGRGTGHGPLGPEANDGGFDALSYWGRSGAGTAAMGNGATFPVMLPGPAFGDAQCGMNLAGGIMAALYRRERTGTGGTVDVSLLGSGLWAMQASIAGAHVRGENNIAQLDRWQPPNPLANLYSTADQHYFVLGMLDADRYWPGFCEALERPELVEDERFASLAVRAKNSAKLVSILDDVFASLTMEEVRSRLSKQEGPWNVVSYPADAIYDEQAQANGFVRHVDYAENMLPVVIPPASLDGDAAAAGHAPNHGAHTDEIVMSLGISEEQLMQLKFSGAVL